MNRFPCRWLAAGCLALFAGAAHGQAAHSAPRALPVTQMDGQIVASPARYKTAAPTAGGSRLAMGGEAPWWAVFYDPGLDQLETMAAAANQDLQQALARLIEAREQARAVAADFYPHLELPLRASRQRTTDTGPIGRAGILGDSFGALLGFGDADASPTANGVAAPRAFRSQPLSITYNDFRAPLTLTYELDVFGRVRASYSQARANAQAAAADRRAVGLSLAAQVATDYFFLRTLDAEASILRGTIRLRRDSVNIQNKRLAAGAASQLDLSRAQVELDNTEADFADIRRQRNEVENALAVLCGQAASDFRVAPHPLGDHPPPAVPAGVPASLLARRPDLVESERRLAAASEGIQIARAAMLPTFTIEGDAGLESARISQLFEGQSRALAAIATVNIPIFEGGRNLANLRAARARREEALAAYRGTALTALREVENALSALRERALQTDARERAVDDANKVLLSSQQLYLQGATNFFDVIDAERLLLGAELARVQTLNARYAATVDLIRALGGGYGAAAGK